MRWLPVALALLSTLPLRAAADGPSAITQVMGPMRWGMSVRAVRRSLTQRKISHRYLVNTTRTGAGEPSFLGVGAHLARRVDESLVLSREQSSRRFYVFRAGKLRKLYMVFDALVLPEGNFAAYAAQLEQRFGRGARRADVHGSWIEWRIATTRVRSVDHTHGYGFYDLLLEDRAQVPGGVKGDARGVLSGP